MLLDTYVSPHERELYQQLSGLFHFKVQILASIPKGASIYAKAASDALDAALAIQFDCLVDQYTEEVGLRVLASQTNDECVGRLMDSFDIPLDEQRAVQEQIYSILKK